MQRSAEAVVTPVFEQPTRVRWLMIGLIFVVDVLMFIDRLNISIAAKYIIPEYGLTEVQMGSVFSAFVLGYALLQIPGGWQLLARYAGWRSSGTRDQLPKSRIR